MKTNERLAERVERLVTELVEAHMKETRATVLAAVAHGLGSAATAPKPPKKESKTRSSRGRRPADELSALAEQLYALVCARPGAPMVSFATELGMTARSLHHPMLMLKKSGRVRSAGERNRTCYFPAVGGESTFAQQA